VRLHRSGHEHAGRVEDRAAAGEQDFLGVLLSLRALQRLLPAVRLQVAHPAEQDPHQHGDADENGGGAGGGKRAHSSDK
jgi:hypothetical protein